MKHCGLIAIFLLGTSILFSQSLLPIYSSPMVFLDSTGNIVGKLPEGYDLINTPDGKHYPGWVKGMAPNSVGEGGLIPAKNYDTDDITLFDRTGKPVVRFSNRYQTVSPAYNGYHIATTKAPEVWAGPTYYFLNTNGERIFSPTGYQAATHFHEGYAAVRKDNKWMYINDLGHELKMIDTSLRQITEVSSFHDGLSRIKLGWGKKCGFETCNDYVFIDEKGAIVLDTRKIFPNERIKRVSDMHDGFSLIVFFTDSTRVADDKIVYLHKSGKIIGPLDYVYRKKEFKGGYAPIVTSKKLENGNTANDSVFLLDPNGKRILFESKDGFRPSEVFHVGDHFYVVSYWNSPEKKGMDKVYDVRTHKFVYETREDIMGVKWDLVSLRNSMTKRFYVVNFVTGEIVYDTDVSDRVYHDIDETVNHAAEITVFECDDETELAKLSTLKGLKELTIRNLKTESLPANLSFPSLEILRIDGLDNLVRLPSHLKGLKKISLRDCVKVVNLMEMLEGQSKLEELYVINFGLTPEEEMKIEKMFPGAKILIQGSKASASSLLQEFIYGF